MQSVHMYVCADTHIDYKISMIQQPQVLHATYSRGGHFWTQERTYVCNVQILKMFCPLTAWRTGIILGVQPYLLHRYVCNMYTHVKVYHPLNYSDVLVHTYVPSTRMLSGCEWLHRLPPESQHSWCHGGCQHSAVLCPAAIEGVCRRVASVALAASSCEQGPLSSESAAPPWQRELLQGSLLSAAWCRERRWRVFLTCCCASQRASSPHPFPSSAAPPSPCR